MSGFPSIRLRFVWRLHSALDHIVQRLSQELRKHEIHSQSRANRKFRSATFDTGCSHGQVQVPVDYTGINEEIRAGQGRLDRLNNSPVYIAHSHRLAAAQHHFIAHQDFPLGSRNSADGLSSVNAKAAGVEP